jgi:aspartate aminotransferase
LFSAKLATFKGLFSAKLATTMDSSLKALTYHSELLVHHIPSSTLLSHRIQGIEPSQTLSLLAKASALRAAGHPVINLGVGEPDFDTPAHIKQAAIDAIHQGYTKYTPVEGLLDCRKAIVTKLARDNALQYDPQQILVSCGAKHSFFNLSQALLNSADEVIIPAPYWVSYPDMVRLAGAQPVIVPCTMAADFKISAAQLAAAISPKTKLLVINSPSNPTGMAYTLEELRALGEVLMQHPQVWIASDDIYEHMLWEKDSLFNILNACPALYARTVIINGVSKSYAMTGWRIGFAAGPHAIIEAMTTLQSQSTSNACSIAQMAAKAALLGDQSCIEPMRQAFKMRHDYLVHALNNLPGIECPEGDGTFYAFPKVEGLIHHLGLTDDWALSDYLLSTIHIAVVPGSAFGAPGHIRLSFATSLENLKEALRRLETIACPQAPL